jgi:ABC-type branched-subunit amino acid transport system substrate-binding protein
MWALLLSCVFSAAGWAQESIPYSKDAEAKFQYALEFFDSGAYYSAASHFEKLAVDFSLNHRTTAAFIMAGRAHLLAGTPVRALRLLENFRSRFPESEYLPESWLISADASRAAESPGRAVEFYLRAWGGGFADTVLLQQRLVELNKPELSAYDQRIARNLLAGLSSRDRLSELLGLTSSAASIPDAETSREARGGGNPSHPAVVGVALPLSIMDARKRRLAEDLLEGMRAALNLHTVEGKFPVELRIFDSGIKDSVEAMVLRCEKNPRVVILLAGAFSEDARTVCEVAAERDLLLLLPMATEDGLTRMGSNIFQLNTPIEERGRLLAEFAAYELHAEEAVILAATDSWPRAMAEAFAEHGKQVGLTVRDTVYYTTGKDDVETACQRLGRDRGVKKRILFAPVRARQDISQVLKGVASSGCVTTILGAGNWNHPDLLVQEGKALTVYYEADVAPDSTLAEMKSLRRELLRLSGRDVSPEALFGFDAMRLSLTLVGNGPTTRREARRKLRTLYRGLRAPVNFQRSRVNHSLNMLLYRDGTVQQLESFHAK